MFRVVRLERVLKALVSAGAKERKNHEVFLFFGCGPGIQPRRDGDRSTRRWVSKPILCLEAIACQGTTVRFASCP
jgi:hypothetical protein